MPNPRIEQILLSSRKGMYEDAEEDIREALRLLGLARGDIEELLERLELLERQYGDYGRLQLLRQAASEVDSKRNLWLELSTALSVGIVANVVRGWDAGTLAAQRIAEHVGEMLLPSEFSKMSMLDALRDQAIPFADNVTQLIEPRIRGELLRGIYNQESVGDLSQRLIGAGLDTKGTPWKTAAARAKATIRTEANRAFHGAMRANLDPQEWCVGYQWMCFFQGVWPCPRCRPLHGRFFAKDQLMSGGGYTVRHPPLHTNCLCQLLPVTRQFGRHTI